MYIYKPKIVQFIFISRSHKCAASISTKGENINIAWSPSGATIAVGNKEDLVSFIDARNYKVVCIIFTLVNKFKAAYFQLCYSYIFNIEFIILKHLKLDKNT